MFPMIAPGSLNANTKHAKQSSRRVFDACYHPSHPVRSINTATPMTQIQESSERAARFEGHRGDNILEFYTQEFRPEPAPAELFRQHIIQWFFAAKHLRFFEVNKLSEKPSEADLASHRMVCSALITFGEYASKFARQFKNVADLSVVGLSVECIEAETRLLRNNFKMFHDNVMTFPEAEAVLAEAFNEA